MPLYFATAGITLFRNRRSLVPLPWFEVAELMAVLLHVAGDSFSLVFASEVDSIASTTVLSSHGFRHQFL